MELSVFLVIDAEVWSVLAVVLVHERMFIAFLISEFQAQRGQDEAKFFLLLASHIHSIAIHVGEQGLEFAAFLLGEAIASVLHVFLLFTFLVVNEIVKHRFLEVLLSQ